MTGGTSSCRPNRLDAFGKITVGIAEALGNRLHTMAPYVDAYLKGCDPQYVVKDVSGDPDQMGGLGIRISNLGHWTGDVATGFQKADSHGGKDAIDTVPDAAIQSRLPAFRKDKVLGPGATEQTPIDWSKPGDPGQELLKALYAQNNALPGTDPTTALTGAKAQHDALDKLGIDVNGDPSAGAGPDLGDWVLGGVSVAQTFASEWQQSKGLPTSTRLGDAAAQATGNATAVGLGAGAQATVDALEAATVIDSGPAAPITGFVVATASTIGINQLLASVLPKPDLNNPTQLTAYSGNIDNAISNGTVDPNRSAAIEQAAVNQAQDVEGAPAGGQTTALNDLNADIKPPVPLQQQVSQAQPPPPPPSTTEMPGPYVMPGAD